MVSVLVRGRRLDLVDDEEAGEHGAAVQDHQLAVAHVDGVVAGGAVGMARGRVVCRVDAAGDAPRRQVTTPAPNTTPGGSAGA